jgi:polysaccharide export outer membrane protein
MKGKKRFVFLSVAVWVCAVLLPAGPHPLGLAQSERAPDAAAFVPAGVGSRDLASSRRNVEDYVLHPGDRVKITIYPEDEYIRGGEMRVSTDGMITLPLIGKVEVGGQKVKDAEAAIRKIIDADYLVHPEVVIEVTQQSELSQTAVVVLGAVKRPGSYQFPAGEVKVTLLRAISEAGGYSDVANISRIRIVRQDDGKKSTIRANANSIIQGDSPDVELKSGDIIHVAESLF